MHGFPLRSGLVARTIAVLAAAARELGGPIIAMTVVLVVVRAGRLPARPDRRA